MKKGKPKLPDLMKVMDSFQMARSILKCGSRSLRHRCDPSVDRDAAMPDLYDEIVLFTTATEMFHDTYEELDNAEMAIYRVKEKRRRRPNCPLPGPGFPLGAAHIPKLT